MDETPTTELTVTQQMKPLAGARLLVRQWLDLSDRRGVDNDPEVTALAAMEQILGELGLADPRMVTATVARSVEAMLPIPMTDADRARQWVEDVAVHVAAGLGWLSPPCQEHTKAHSHSAGGQTLTHTHAGPEGHGYFEHAEDGHHG